MALIKERGTIAILGKVQTGTSQSGNGWANQQIVVDVEGFNGSFRKVALKAGTNQVRDLEQMQIGDKVEISYQVTAREWQGKWYNNVDLIRIESLEQTMPQAYQQMGYAPQAVPNPPQAVPNPPQANPQFPQTPVVQNQQMPRRRVQSQPLIPQNANLSPMAEDMPF